MLIPDSNSLLRRRKGHIHKRALVRSEIHVLDKITQQLFYNKMKVIQVTLIKEKSVRIINKLMQQKMSQDMTMMSSKKSKRDK
jgi:hypothetical protein